MAHTLSKLEDKEKLPTQKTSDENAMKNIKDERLIDFMNVAQLYECVNSVTDEEVERLQQFRLWPFKMELGSI